MILRGLNLNFKFIFGTKPKYFHLFYLYWCMYFIMQNTRSLKEAFDFQCRRIDFDVCESTMVVSVKRPWCMRIDLYAKRLARFHFRGRANVFIVDLKLRVISILFTTVDCTVYLMYCPTSGAKCKHDWMG